MGWRAFFLWISLSVSLSAPFSLQEEQEEHLRLLLPLFQEHLPEKLVDVAFDRVPTTLPPQYLRNAMASCLACRVVYNEGEALPTWISWGLLGALF